jgi:DNA-binding GntR family transcriptional regulator
MKRCFVVPEITLDRSKSQPLRHQIYSQIAGDIRRGVLLDGYRLPSSRLLAKLLHVSRSTIVDAYEELLENGLIKARANSGTDVVGPAAPGTVPNFAHLRRTARAAHYPARTMRFEDPDGTGLYLNASR